ncbi:alpha,alpha-trehalose phosphorylase [Geosporobacter subterraneus DSM 17957]|uniref:Alpha,alpha-trehalose phosphorylase n=1 Tax=Geosporobacter subterraneus DSM 17957 TaxID=1121919 RepID=A0A1M6L5E6_9FIRM|nr:glycosyl hydrolase family 65 protein [Geosporobacter subterraneus]SHJ66432.1 alpha,alpha-trehalose phosphorylase [Geosporobacter subterraneus DSM 17957]
MWKLESSSLDVNVLPVEESLYALANGYLGIRGCFEEGYPQEYTSIRGTYINGFYDLIEAKYSEKLFGFPEVQEKMPNLMDAQTMEIYLDGERVSLFNGCHTDYKRALYFDKGYAERSFVYRTQKGKTATVRFRRMVSFQVKELLLIEAEVQYDGEIRIRSIVDGNVSNYTDDFDPRVGEHAQLLDWKSSSLVDEAYMVLKARTKKLDFEVCCGVYHRCSKPEISVVIGGEHEPRMTAEYATSGNITLTKYAAYCDSRCQQEPVEHRVLKIIKEQSYISLEDHLTDQRKYLENFWKHSDIQIFGDDLIQQGVRFSLFQLLQSAGKDGLTNIAAKGLTGEGYEGHYFWDTEIYILPFFQLTQPQIAEKLLTYRHSILDQARNEARTLGHRRGVKYPWRTIAGRECSTFFPAGSAQYHINGDVAYGFIQHYLQHKNLDFICHYGAEVVFETARTWLEIGHFSNGKFMIHSVTGPDEYTCIVNNNYYTNVMARYNMEWAVKLYHILKEERPEALKGIIQRIQMQESEIDEMISAYKNMYLPYDEQRKIHKQDDTFLDKALWDFEGTPEDKYPLLLHYHPLTIYRYQVIKQADTVLAHFLLEDDLEDEIIRNTFDYYEKVTTHDSSLSSCIYGIMASRCGYCEKAYDYFMETVRLDLDNTHGNTKDGLHVANLGGTALSVIFGFAGYRIKDTGISLRPWCPENWSGYEFKLFYRGRQLRVNVTDHLEIELLEGERLEIKVYDKQYGLDSLLKIPLEGMKRND